MHLFSIILAAASILPSSYAQSTYTTSSKRGLVYVPSQKHPGDNWIWTKAGSDLTWYYNYQVQPSSVYSNLTQSEFEFIPMLWGLSDISFTSEVLDVIKGGRDISHVLTFNEPDGTSGTGGSAITPEKAATAWIQEIEPLRKMGIKAGAPAVTGSQGGFTWLSSFFASCETQGTNCTVDFFPVHYYGNFEGLASHLGQLNATYPNVSQWITEWALNDEPLSTTQTFFNGTINYLDKLSNVERYSYFGSFRSDVSNVGPNAAMLDQTGALTDIGSWYLGGAATHNIPQATGGAVRKSSCAWSLVVVASIAFILL